ncbi:MAG TPA: crotonase/enoyl-CoA hydratase family protein [Acidimicrobiia bacterium]|nr:crotonase/enoyl-CoA hydratase family protein [Acidimicrobiia bacterium]
MSDEKVTVGRDGHVLSIGVNRPEKKNAWDVDIIQGVARGLQELADEPELRVGVIFGHGPDFSAGLDLMSVAPLVAGGRGASVLPAGLPDPWDFLGEPCPKPVVVAVHGRCFTLGIELILASQVTIAAADTQFAQLEVARGIVPLGGATLRLGERLGSVGLRYLLTAETFDAPTALDAGLVTEVVAVGRQLERAREVAGLIAANAPLAVQAALAASRAAERGARDAAARAVGVAVPARFNSADAAEAISAMVERRTAVFTGR